VLCLFQNYKPTVLYDYRVKKTTVLY